MRVTMSDRRAVIKGWSREYGKGRKKGEGGVVGEV